MELTRSDGKEEHKPIEPQDKYFSRATGYVL